jgi:hypothetical protein
MTTLERAILAAIVRSEYGSGEADTGSIWTFSVWDNIDRFICPNRKSLSGGISSLVQKGLVASYEAGKDSTIRLTDAGVAAYKGAL